MSNIFTFDICFSLELKPKDCVAVAEVEVELLTGRTHQIRGQLATLGFPLCGDSLYGGALSDKSSIDYNEIKTSKPDGYRASEFLCLQCCELSFCDPCKEKGRNVFRLEGAWWSTWLSEYTEIPEVEATTSTVDGSNVIKSMYESNSIDLSRKEKNISRIPLYQLSPGKNEYVIIKALADHEDAKPVWLIR